jgi:hypothetical protein
MQTLNLKPNAHLCWAALLSIEAQRLKGTATRQQDHRHGCKNMQTLN